MAGRDDESAASGAEADRDEKSAASEAEADRDSAGTYFVSVEDFEWRPEPEPDDAGKDQDVTPSRAGRAGGA